MFARRAGARARARRVRMWSGSESCDVSPIQTFLASRFAGGRAPARPPLERRSRYPRPTANQSLSVPRDRLLQVQHDSADFGPGGQFGSIRLGSFSENAAAPKSRFPINYLHFALRSDV